MTKYIKFVFKNKEPLRIADDNSSQSGQMITLRYIPGTTIRGYVVNQLARENDFEKLKKDLFSNHVRYLNAYISMENQELIPSPKGFYEKKVMKENDTLVNIVVKQVELDEKKRAALGRYCYFDQNRIHYYNVGTGSDLKIKINLEEGEKQNVFRNEYIEPGYLFTGYIAVDYKPEKKEDLEEKKALLERIKSVFHDEIILGNARSSGFGKCEIVDCKITEELPYQSFLADTDQVNECYMLLLSNTTLRNQQGELCGFNEGTLDALGEKMHVKNLQIAYCATSITTVRGYNRTWGVKIPSTVAYEQGSVFHLKYEGTLTVETIRELSNAGIGIRRNEGFGRVLFLKDGYEKINLKQLEEYFANTVEKESLPVMNPEDKKVICIAAGSYYKSMLQQGLQKFVLESRDFFKDTGASVSQLGILDSVITAYQYNPEQAISSLKKYLSESDKREENNRIQKQHNSLQNIGKFIEDEILDKSKKIKDIAGFKGKNEGCIMGISTSELLPEDEEKQMKLKVILDLIRFSNKGEK